MLCTNLRTVIVRGGWSASSLHQLTVYLPIQSFWVQVGQQHRRVRGGHQRFQRGSAGSVGPPMGRDGRVDDGKEDGRSAAAHFRVR